MKGDLYTAEDADLRGFNRGGGGAGKGEERGERGERAGKEGGGRRGKEEEWVGGKSMCKAVQRQMKGRSEETVGESKGRWVGGTEVRDGGRRKRGEERSGRTANTNEFVSKVKLTGSASRSSRGESPVTSRAAALRSPARTLPGKR